MSAGGGKSSSRGHGDVIPPFPGERQRALARRNYIVLLALVLVAAGLSVSVAYWGWRAPGIPTDFQAVWTIDEPRSDGVVPHLGVSAADEAPGPRALRFEGEGWTETVRVSATGVVEGAEPGARRLIFSLPGPSIGALFSGSERVRGDLRAEIAPFATGLPAPMTWTAPAAGAPGAVYAPPGFGPRWVWIREARDPEGRLRARALHDAATGVLLRLEDHGPEGLRAMTLRSTSLPLPRPRLFAAGALAVVVLGWVAFHLRSMRGAGLIDAIDAPGAARLAVRLLAFPLLDCGLCSGFAMIHGDGAAVWAADALGLALLLWAIGPYALLTLPKLAGAVSGVGYPYFVPFFGGAVLTYTLVRYARRVTRSVLWPL